MSDENTKEDQKEDDKQCNLQSSGFFEATLQFSSTPTAAKSPPMDSANPTQAVDPDSKENLVHQDTQDERKQHSSSTLITQDLGDATPKHSAPIQAEHHDLQPPFPFPPVPVIGPPPMYRGGAQNVYGYHHEQYLDERRMMQARAASLDAALITGDVAAPKDTVPTASEAAKAVENSTYAIGNLSLSNADGHRSALECANADGYANTDGCDSLPKGDGYFSLPRGAKVDTQPKSKEIVAASPTGVNDQVASKGSTTNTQAEPKDAGHTPGDSEETPTAFKADSDAHKGAEVVTQSTPPDTFLPKANPTPVMALPEGPIVEVSTVEKGLELDTKDAKVSPGENKSADRDASPKGAEVEPIITDALLAKANPTDAEATPDGSSAMQKELELVEKQLELLDKQEELGNTEAAKRTDPEVTDPEVITEPKPSDTTLAMVNPTSADAPPKGPPEDSVAEDTGAATTTDPREKQSTSADAPPKGPPEDSVPEDTGAATITDPREKQSTSAEAPPKGPPEDSGAEDTGAATTTDPREKQSDGNDTKAATTQSVTTPDSDASPIAPTTMTKTRVKTSNSNVQSKGRHLPPMESWLRPPDYGKSTSDDDSDDVDQPPQPQDTVVASYPIDDSDDVDHQPPQPQDTVVASYSIDVSDEDGDDLDKQLFEALALPKVSVASLIHPDSEVGNKAVPEETKNTFENGIFSFVDDPDERICSIKSCVRDWWSKKVSTKRTTSSSYVITQIQDLIQHDDVEEGVAAYGHLFDGFEIYYNWKFAKVSPAGKSVLAFLKGGFAVTEHEAIEKVIASSWTRFILLQRRSDEKKSKTTPCAGIVFSFLKKPNSVKHFGIFVDYLLVNNKSVGDPYLSSHLLNNFRNRGVGRFLLRLAHSIFIMEAHKSCMDLYLVAPSSLITYYEGLGFIQVLMKDWATQKLLKDRSNLSVQDYKQMQRMQLTHNRFIPRYPCMYHDNREGVELHLPRVLNFYREKVTDLGATTDVENVIMMDSLRQQLINKDEEQKNYAKSCSTMSKTKKTATLQQFFFLLVSCCHMQ